MVDTRTSVEVAQHLPQIEKTNPCSNRLKYTKNISLLPEGVRPESKLAGRNAYKSKRREVFLYNIGSEKVDLSSGFEILYGSHNGREKRN